MLASTYYKTPYRSKKRKRRSKKPRTVRRALPRPKLPLNLRTGGNLGREVKWVDYRREDTVKYDPLAGAVEDQQFRFNPSTPGTTDFGCYNAIQQGTGVNQRDGRKIVMTSWHVNWRASCANTLDRSFRLVLVCDTQNNSQTRAPTIQTVFEGIGIDQTTNTLQFRNLEQTQRFKILYDKTHVIKQDISSTQTGGTTDGFVSTEGTRTGKINIKMRIPVNYTGNSSPPVRS